MKRFWIILAAFLGLAAATVPASADVVWTLTQGGSVGPNGNYGTITAHQQTSDTIRVTIALTFGSNSDGTPVNRFVTTGSHSGIAWNIAGNPTISNISVVSGNSAFFQVQPFANPGTYGDPPAGTFEYAIAYTGPNGAKALQNSITFDIKFASNTVLAPSLFSSNSSGNVWGVDLITGCHPVTVIKDGRPKTETQCGNTGVVAALPEPGTISMSIAGLMGVAGLVVLQRRRKQVRA